MAINKAQSSAAGRGFHASQVSERFWLRLVFSVALLLVLFNQPYSPATWFDEGSHLHVPKTLVQHGVYADISSEGYRYYGPTIGVGPTVMLPIALAFKLFGIGLLQARLVVAAYVVAALIAFYGLGRRLYGPSVALLALGLLLASRTFSYDGFIEYGRQVLGEVPGLAFLFVGALAWIAALQRIQHNAVQHQPGYRILVGCSGLAWGLALATKNQFVLIVPPALLLVGLLDWRYYRVGTWLLRLAPLAILSACYGFWTVAQFQFLGPGTFFENMQQTRQAAGGAIFVFNGRAMLRAGYYLVRPDLYGGLLLPALGYTLWRARRRTKQGLSEALIASVVVVWLTWFVGASLAWPRYAFPAVAFGALLVARAVRDISRWLWQHKRRRPFAMVLGAYTVLIIALPLVLSIRAAVQPNTSAQQFAQYLNTTVPTAAIIETWEPELGFLTDHRYHYPPISLLDTAVRHQWLDGPPIRYNGLEAEPAYVVIGPFGDYTAIYPASTLARDYTRQQQIGPYTLYAHN